MEAPARFTTASADWITSWSIVPAAGYHSDSNGPFGVRRTSAMTSCPSARKDSVSAVPIRPEAPEMTTRMACSLQSDFGLEGAFFDALLYCLQETSGVGSVHDAVVVAEREVAH